MALTDGTWGTEVRQGDLRGRVEERLRESWGLSFLEGSGQSVSEPVNMYLLSAYVSGTVLRAECITKDRKSGAPGWLSGWNI